MADLAEARLTLASRWGRKTDRSNQIAEMELGGVG
jgi:hypothetical protein